MIRKEISTVRLAPAQMVRAVGEARTARVSQSIAMSRPVVGLQGVPGDPDQHSFLTEAFKNMVTAQIGNGNRVTTILAYSTNQNQARDYDSGRFGGFYAPAGEYLQPLLDTFQQSVDEFGRDTFVKTGKRLDPERREALPVNRPVVVGRATARPLTTNVVQESDVW